jgi:transposase
MLPFSSSSSTQLSCTPLPPAPATPKPKRGGQPGNQNARTAGTFSAFQPGPLSPTRQLAHDLQLRLQDPTAPLDRIVEEARTARRELSLPSPAAVDEFVPAFRIYLQFSNIITRAYSACIPARRLSDALSSIAHDPFGWFERGYLECGITRDADSFLPVSEKGTYYSPLPPDHPRLATNLTDSQWAVLAPLIPPDHHLDWLTGQPPVIIAASRWGFTQYHYTSGLNDSAILKKYYQVLQRFPALCTSIHSPNPKDLGMGQGWGRGPGRPRTSPRLLLDAILWKLATAQPWQALPPAFPPMRLCRKYYRRLLRSGRVYTLLLALYNHMRTETSIDLPGLLEAGVFTTTSSQKIALSPAASPTRENYTALLFMQLARSAYSRLHRQDQQIPPICARFPDFKGASALSTGELPFHEINQPISCEADQPCFSPLSQSEGLRERPGVRAPRSRAASRRRKSASIPERAGLADDPGDGFLPLESSPAWQKWCKIEHDQKIIAREVAKRLRPVEKVRHDQPAPGLGGSVLCEVEGPAVDDPVSALLDEWHAH